MQSSALVDDSLLQPIVTSICAGSPLVIPLLNEAAHIKNAFTPIRISINLLVQPTPGEMIAHSRVSNTHNIGDQIAYNSSPCGPSTCRRKVVEQAGKHDAAGILAANRAQH